MTELIQWGRPSMVSLQRDLEEVLEDFAYPRAFRREMDRLFDEVSAPRALWREMDRLMEEFESPPTLRRRITRLFDDFVSAVKRPFAREKATFVPSVDLAERDNEYVLKADLPGMREQDIDLRIDDDNVLTIKGERREEETKRVRGYEYSERSYGTFSRSVSLPSGVDASKIEADFRHGVLEIRIPKTEAARARKIPISREEPRVIAPSNGPTAQAQQGQARVT
jgi:HSP20 family protein